MLKRVALLAGIFLIIGFVIVEFRLTERFLDMSPAAFFVFAMFMASGAVPMARHVTLFLELENSLIDRLGPILGEDRQPGTLPYFFSGFMSELKTIEKEHGSQLTEREWGLLRGSRRLFNLCRVWVVVAMLGLLVYFQFIRG